MSLDFEATLDELAPLTPDEIRKERQEALDQLKAASEARDFSGFTKDGLFCQIVSLDGLRFLDDQHNMGDLVYAARRSLEEALQETPIAAE